ncbi:LOW QUALITY PROTEIN: PPR domain-containing protein/PPR_1 domain-containing protein/PPR_2 domain-containing protein, partial [Cephalotus follicularis]
REGRLVHNQIITNVIDSNHDLSTKIIIFYSKIGDSDADRKVFDTMPKNSVVSWTAMISGYTQNGFYENSLLVFSDMHPAGVKANHFTYGSALRATSLRCLDRGLQIQGYVHKERFGENLVVKSALLDLHSKCGNMEDAYYLFETMSIRDIVSWNAMINGYIVQGFADDSFRVFCSMMREGSSPERVDAKSVLRMSARSGGLMKVNQIHKFIIQLGFQCDNPLIGSLIDAYAKSGSIGSAHYLYRNMSNKDIVSCTAQSSGCASVGNYDIDALDLFKEISQIHMGIDGVLLCSMLNICANIASLSLGRQMHAIALKCHSICDMAMSNALIDMYAKCGEIDEARRVFDEMGEKNVITWTSLIAGYGKHGYWHEAVSLYEKMEFEGLKPTDVKFLSLLF